MKFKIEYLKNKTKYGFIGMNKAAAQAHNIPFHHKANVIEIYKTSKPIMHATEKHEEIEYNLMRKGLPYHQAHKYALKYEDSTMRVDKIIKQIKEKGGY